jgi:hypothetical protein
VRERTVLGTMAPLALTIAAPRSRRLLLLALLVAAALGVTTRANEEEEYVGDAVRRAARRVRSPPLTPHVDMTCTDAAAE